MNELITSAVLSVGLALGSISTTVMAESTQPEATQKQTHHATGVVQNIHPEAGRITLKHGEVPSLKWPPMNMPFAVEDVAMLQGLDVGQEVQFEFVEGEEGMYRVTKIEER